MIIRRRHLNYRGHGHFMIMLVVVAIAIIGTFTIVASHADTPGQELGTVVLKRVAGHEVSRELGIGDDDRGYLITVYGQDRDGPVPLQGVKVKFSSYNRSKTHGCGINGPLGHKFRDSSSTTNNKGTAYFGACTPDDYAIVLSKVPHDYTGVVNVNFNDPRQVHIEKINDGTGGGTFVDIQIHLQVRFRKYTPDELHKFAAATYAWWQPAHDSGKIHVTQAECSPYEVSVKYTLNNFGQNNPHVPDHAYAFAYLFSANKPRDSRGRVLVHAHAHYCRMWMSYDPAYAPVTNNRGNACVIFMHEYGHMLGYEHNNNIHSVMYEPPANARNWQQLRDANWHEVFTASKCSQYF